MHRLPTSHDNLAVRAAHKSSTGAASPNTGKHLLKHGQNVFWGMSITISRNRCWMDSFILLPILFYCEDTMDLIKGPQTVKTGGHMPAQSLHANTLLFNSAGLSTSVHSGCRINCNHSSPFLCRTQKEHPWCSFSLHTAGRTLKRAQLSSSHPRVTERFFIYFYYTFSHNF